MYKSTTYSTSQKRVKKISKRHKVAIASMVEELMDNPFIGKFLTRDLSGKYSLRVGVYRIIYTVNKNDKVVHMF